MTDTDVDRPPCPFCNPPRDKILFEDEIVIALWDGYPASPGHTLLVPRRHVESWFEAFSDEKNALIESIDKAKSAIEKLYTPDAYNIGINAGRAAGQTIFHLHVHVIPRYAGDVGDPARRSPPCHPRQGQLPLGIRDAVPAYESHPYPLLISGGEAESFARPSEGAPCNRVCCRHRGRIHNEEWRRHPARSHAGSDQQRRSTALPDR